jgi:hypothetical protein
VGVFGISMATQVEAMKVASDIGESVTHDRSREGRHNFEYEGVVQAHRLPDDWMFVGFGTGWFAIREK